MASNTEQVNAPPRVGMHAVAKEAGVSVATVSNVINRPELVSPPLQRRVAKAVTKFGFIPNAAARSLRTGRTDLIGAVVFDLANPFFAVVSRHMSNAANDRGFGLTVMSTDQDPIREAASLDFLLRQGVSGIVVTSALPDLDRLVAIREQGIAVTLLAQESDHPSIGSVHVDDFAGMKLLVEHLVSTGHTKIGFIDGPGEVRQHVVRRNALLQVLADSHLDPDQHLRTVTAFAPDSDGGRAAMDELLKISKGQLDAVVCINDYTAVGAMLALRAAGLKVPQDVAVTGFDDIEMAELLAVPLTTIRQPTAELGKTVIEQLIDGGSTTGAMQHRVLAPELMIRRSTGG